MTANAAAVEGGEFLGLPEYVLEHEDRSRPSGKSEQGDRAGVATRAESVRRRLHDVTVLSALAVIQVTWLTALAYGLWLLA